MVEGGGPLQGILPITPRNNTPSPTHSTLRTLLHRRALSPSSSRVFGGQSFLQIIRLRVTPGAVVNWWRTLKNINKASREKRDQRKWFSANRNIQMSVPIHCEWAHRTGRPQYRLATEQAGHNTGWAQNRPAIIRPATIQAGHNTGWPQYRMATIQAGHNTDWPQYRVAKVQASHNTGRPQNRLARIHAGHRTGRPQYRPATEQDGHNTGRPQNRLAKIQAGHRTGWPQYRPATEQAGHRTGWPKYRLATEQAGHRTGWPQNRQGHRTDRAMEQG